MMIRCEIFSNSKCIKCGQVMSEMVHVGALTMCHYCFIEEFGFAAEFEPDSAHGIKYYDWLAKAVVG